MKEVENNSNIYPYGEHEILELMNQLNPQELEKFSEKISPLQVQLAILSLKEPTSPHWSAKLHALFTGVKNIAVLEAIGRAINLDQLLQFIEFGALDREQAWKLFPVFVTISHPLFSQMLLEMPEGKKMQLQNLCASEPIQHHLLLFIHELKAITEDFENEYYQKQAEIKQISGINLEPKDLATIQSGLGDFRDRVNMVRFKIENALSLAWNASSGDLIELLSEQREGIERFLYSMIGHPHHNNTNASGLYRLLEDQLSKIFGKDINGAEYDALKDNEPAIEALARLNLWYIEDYWKIGLLPQESDSTKLSLPFITEDNLLEKYRNLVEQNLRLIGLKTIKDFKRHHLVSKPLLIDYIAKHQHKIK